MHLHRPKPLHGWRELSVEIGVIVVGIIIALGLEQTVEFFHHRAQREDLTEALRKDGERNRTYIKTDIDKSRAILDWALEQASAVQRAEPLGALTIHRLPSSYIGSPDAGVWPSARASGVSNLLPASAQNWLEYLDQINDEIFVSSACEAEQLYGAYAASDQLIIGHATETRSRDIDLSPLDPAQRSMAMERLRAIAEHARSVMRKLVVYDIGNEYILSTPFDRLDTPEAGQHYEEIYREEMKAYPAAGYSFGGD
jgi:hypothetical protein